MGENKLDSPLVITPLAHQRALWPVEGLVLCHYLGRCPAWLSGWQPNRPRRRQPPKGTAAPLLQSVMQLFNPMRLFL